MEQRQAKQSINDELQNRPPTQGEVTYIVCEATIVLYRTTYHDERIATTVLDIRVYIVARPDFFDIAYVYIRTYTYETSGVISGFMITNLGYRICDTNRHAHIYILAYVIHYEPLHIIDNKALMLTHKRTKA